MVGGATYIKQETSSVRRAAACKNAYRCVKTFYVAALTCIIATDALLRNTG